jgi:hypothetical protein
MMLLEGRQPNHYHIENRQNTSVAAVIVVAGGSAAVSDVCRFDEVWFGVGCVCRGPVFGERVPVVSGEFPQGC